MLITLCGAALVLAYWRVAGLSTYTWDVAGYWERSLYWRDPFDQYHLPGYPLIIALARGATGGLVGRIPLMTGIAVTAVLAGVHGTYTLASMAGLSRRVSLTAATAFGLWPFVGVIYAAYPVADPLVLALALWGTVFLIRERAVVAGLALGAAAVTHKGLWPAIALLVTGHMLVPGRRRTGIVTGGIAAAPLLALWVSGVLSGHAVGWLLSASADDAAQPWPSHSLRFLDGLMGTALYGDWLARGRLIVVTGILVLATVVLMTHIRRWREPLHLAAAVFAGQIVFMDLTLTQHLIWASVRFSGLLAVPAAWAASRAIDAWPGPRWRYISLVVVVALMASQLVTAAEVVQKGWVGLLGVLVLAP